jgi:hypothetical protein
MAEVDRFTIQRDDGAWYAGERADGTPQWTRELRERHVFASEMEARELLRRLQRAGERAALYGLLED